MSPRLTRWITPLTAALVLTVGMQPSDAAALSAAAAADPSPVWLLLAILAGAVRIGRYLQRRS
jgi:hypothetical protein